jgi:hypothetical protein
VGIAAARRTVGSDTPATRLRTKLERDTCVSQLADWVAAGGLGCVREGRDDTIGCG